MPLVARGWAAGGALRRLVLDERPDSRELRRMMLHTTRFLSVFPALVLLAACDSSGEGVLPPSTHEAAEGDEALILKFGDHAGHAESTLSRADIASGFTVDGDWLLSPPLAAPDGASRVGALVHLATPGAMPAMEAAGIDAQGGSTGWLPLGQTFGEDGSFVGVAELGATVGTARLRLWAGDMDRISQLVWAAVVPEEPVHGALGVVEGALSADLAALGVTPRSTWKARPTKCTTKDAAKTRMAIHYTVTPSDNPMARVRAIQAYHMDSLGWCDIGYHLLVGVDGTAYEGRPMQMLGSHVGGNNSGNVGISFVGCFHPSGCSTWTPLQPPQVMLDSGALLLGALSKAWGIPLDTTHVKGHRQHSGQSTSCPGDYLVPHIPSMLAAAAKPAGQGSGAGSGSGSGSGAGGSGSGSGSGSGGSGSGGSGSGGSGSGGSGSGSGSGGSGSGQPTPTCGGLSCGQCSSTSGCGWCASQGGCLTAGSGCQWAGVVDKQPCWSELWPCWVASCWNPEATLKKCGTWTQDEDFSSGKFSVHRYWATLPAGTTTLRLERKAGDYAPALLVTDTAGAVIAAGQVAALHSKVSILSAVSGRTGAQAEVTLHAKAEQPVMIYVTGWSILDAGFKGSLSKAVKYRLSAVNDCAAPKPVGWWTPAPGTTWQWQLTGAVNTSVDVAVYDIDLFDVPAQTIASLKASGRRVICYFSAGTYEPWRLDAANFPQVAIGSPVDGWPDERWLDIRNEQVRTAMRVRLDLAVQKGCDAVEPDNVDGYANSSGFPLSAAHQTDYNTFLAAEAHARGLSVGLKNALGLIATLEPHFDWALNEECHAYGECAFLKPFVSKGKAVLHVEYVEAASQAPAKAAAICGSPSLAGFSTLIKTWELDASGASCK